MTLYFSPCTLQRAGGVQNSAQGGAAGAAQLQERPLGLLVSLVHRPKNDACRSHDLGSCLTPSAARPGRCPDNVCAGSTPTMNDQHHNSSGLRRLQGGESAGRLSRPLTGAAAPPAPEHSWSWIVRSFGTLQGVSARLLCLQVEGQPAQGVCAERRGVYTGDGYASGRRCPRADD